MIEIKLVCNCDLGYVCEQCMALRHGCAECERTLAPDGSDWEIDKYGAVICHGCAPVADSGHSSQGDAQWDSVDVLEYHKLKTEGE